MRQRESVNAADSSLKAFERVKDVFISMEPFTADNGLLTPTLKLKRFVAKKRYQKELDLMYALAAATEAVRERRYSAP